MVVLSFQFSVSFSLFSFHLYISLYFSFSFSLYLSFFLFLSFFLSLSNDVQKWSSKPNVAKAIKTLLDLRSGLQVGNNFVGARFNGLWLHCYHYFDLISRELRMRLIIQMITHFGQNQLIKQGRHLRSTR